MRRTLLAFFGFSFVVYWLFTADLPYEAPTSLEPVIPSLVRVSRLPARVTNYVRRHLNDEPQLRAWLRRESLHIGRIDPDPAGTFKRLHEQAAHLTAQELNWLKTTSVDRTMSGDERFLAVYMLGLSDDPAALSLLKQISHSAIAPAKNDRAYSDDVIVRAHALEAVIKRLSPSQSAAYLREILSQTPDPAVARHAQYWLSHLG